MASPDSSLVAVLRQAAHDQIQRRSIRDLEVTLDHVVAAAFDMVPSAIGGGISRTEANTVRSSHATSEVIHELDTAQSDFGEGPCIDAADRPPDDGVVLVVDLTAADTIERWPRFAPLAVARGFRSMLSTNLSSVFNARRSALNLYAPEPGAFAPADQVTAGLFAIQASSVLYGADEAASLTQALGTRDVIGQAKGILIERFGVDSDGAFEMLVNSSQSTNMKLTKIAEWLITETVQANADDGQRRAERDTWGRRSKGPGDAGSPSSARAGLRRDLPC